MKRVAAFGKTFFGRINDADVFGLSAQLAYFFLLSLFPFLLFLITLLGYLPIDEQSFMGFIDTYAPPEITELINTNLNQLINAQNGGLLSIGIIGTLWSASNGVNAITKAFNRAYEVEEDRSFIVARLIAIALTISMVVVICVAFLLPIFGRTIGIYLFSFFGLSDDFIHVWNTLRWIISSIVFFIVLLALYKLAPNKKIRLRNAMWGAIFATIGWQLVSLAFSYYVSTIGNYSATYGSLGAVIILMIWFYISGIIIITGGIINAMIREEKMNAKK
ncbi:YihY/virulence factor BrkB family protein [Virgibacillus alimentarius]|uniref:Membrane protein n=1 Tax=Virgibacillus alimentarius TaxID=698769 RepID=A0ABS4SBL9_9BACI|nr:MULTISPECIES: YihY/virulence factor BrkB family protein [Virgibacillus]MBP2258511.1 membrane protein [Virgibacillus alimentarius]HLR67493.1 YihY/virulence factor BrkB family protein [Virgibacillus sp.]